MEILEEEGLRIEDADDGTTAVEKLKEKGPDVYDFILMDIQMPVMNGYEATKAIRELIRTGISRDHCPFGQRLCGGPAEIL